ncbi:MAG: protein translocase subunit SecD [Planctomycetes bacterium]|nr:protein translocase subunit SecD [Planctomycetota bacterium]
MTGKNLLLKLGVVVAIVAIGISLLLFYGLKLGIDLRGGHSLTFEIRTTDASGKPLSGIADRGDLPEQVISILKRRIDPNGFMSLEWRPLRNNRIEIRMPIADEQSRQAKNAYVDAREKLREGNIQRSSIREIEDSQGPDRVAMIEKIGRGDNDLNRQLQAATRVYDASVQARQDLQTAIGQYEKASIALAAEEEKDPRSPRLGELRGKANAAGQDKEKAQQAADNAAAEYRGVIDGIRAANINILELERILSLYVSKAEEKLLTKDKVESKKNLFGKQIAALRVRHKPRDAEIDGVVGLYKDWAGKRKTFDDPADLKRLVAKSGVLSFRIAPVPQERAAKPEAAMIAVSAADREAAIKSLEKEGPEGLRKKGDKLQWFAINGEEHEYGGLIVHSYAGTSYMLLYNQPGYMLLRGSGDEAWTVRAFGGIDDKGRPAVHFSMDPNGADKLRKLTSDHLKHCMAILLDDEVYSAPIINGVISDSGIIEGKFSRDQVNELVQTMEAGALPAMLNPNPVAESTFGPGIGQENLESAVRVAYWATFVIIAIMLAYYMFCGAVADMALLLNVLLILATMAFLRATFTMPGIAGLILSIGMAVDANVLIYERLREEQLKGQSVRMALKNAYDRAFSAIFDSNITTLITCAILGWLGSEEIRGFAITLGLGVIFNLFSAVFVTKWIFQAMLDGRVIHKPLRMLKIIGVGNIDWMGKKKVFWTFSAILIAVGIAATAMQGKNLMGIEFTSGTQAVLQFKGDALINNELPNDNNVREAFSERSRKIGNDKLTTAVVETVISQRHAGEFLRDHDTNKDGRVGKAEWLAQGKNPRFFDLLAKEAGKSDDLTLTDLEKHLPSATFQVSTMETNVKTIKDVAKETFGTALDLPIPYQFQLHRGRLTGQAGSLLGESGQVALSESGITKIGKSVVEQIRPALRKELEDFEDGVLFFITLTPDNAELKDSSQEKPAMTEQDLRQRIREMRLQPDYNLLAANQFNVIGLERADKDSFRSFLVAARPEDPSIAKKDDSWQKFAASERGMLAEAINRSTAMVATNFDAAIAGEAKQKAIMAIILSWMAMVIYLWLRFGSVRWGAAAVVCLVHNTLIVVGFVALSGWLHSTFIGRLLGVDLFKIDLAMVAAILTLIGYGINDTIVVFDRIRENRGKLTNVTQQIVNDSINQTLSRTILTGGSVILVVLMMYIWGGQGVHAFNYAFLLGILFSTYSSIAVAAPLLLPLGMNLFGPKAAPPAESSGKTPSDQSAATQVAQDKTLPSAQNQIQSP